ncbi:MAG: cytochrome c, partial [Chloroflexi bacterium]|nr:cytochrome c [Chloroflexota bacterium]
GQGGAIANSPINTSEYLAGVTDDALRQVILNGVTGMPGFAGTISDQDISAVIALLRSWQR